jgi:hypothetical protein
VGKEPNVEEGRCDACEAGKYSSVVGNGLCALCAGGKYSEIVGSATDDDCEECEDGKFSGAGSSSCATVTGIAATADHGWDFRGCVDGGAVVDEGAGSELQATLMNGASCTAEGVAFDGVDDYVDLDDWEWGGALTIEVYVKYDTFRKWSRVLDFSDEGADNVILANHGVTRTVAFNVVQGQQWKDLYSSSWDQSEWVHVVAIASGSTMTVFKNGALAGVNEGGHEPLQVARTQHWLGRSAWESDGFFNGTIAFVRVWHGVGLGEEDVEALFLEREVGAR